MMMQKPWTCAAAYSAGTNMHLMDTCYGVIMEVDPPLSTNATVAQPATMHTHGTVSQGLGSRDLESSMNGNAIPNPGTLKRSNSAPMINVLVATSTVDMSPPNCFPAADPQRTRRYSSSSTNMTPVKVADRLLQLKQEESHIADRDIQREREVRSSMQISTSITDFHLDDNDAMIAENSPRRPRSFSESLHIFTSPAMIGPVGTPSPTRVGKQCYSPSMKAPIKNNTFTPSPSPSPTSKMGFRSLSPIIMRPSHLGKRKLDHDGCDYMSPPKKFHTGPSTPERLIPHPLAHSSISYSSLEVSSPESTIVRSASIHAVPISSQPQPHMYGFMPLRNESQDMQTTDSETSDVTESTDMSEAGDSSSSSMLLVSSSSSSENHPVFNPVSSSDNHSIFTPVSTSDNHPIFTPVKPQSSL